MRWIKNYQLFLFDFDGLLVNTEEIHYQAYKNMCAQRGFTLDWDFPKYCSIAHYTSGGLEEQIYADFPKLKAIEPSWKVLYGEKKQAFLDLVQNGAVHLMPGVETLLQALQEAGINRCVVTHSADELVSSIRKHNPILNSIPYWITREHYSQPKPSSECYLKAIEMLADENDKVIGFEDTPRGLQALMGTRANPVLVCDTAYPEIPSFIQNGVKHFTNLNNVFNDS